MSSSASPAPSRRKTLLSLGVLALLTGIVVFIFREHWAEISEALSRLTLGQGLLALAVGLSYPLLEGVSSWLIVRSRLPHFPLRQGIDNAWMGTFGNVVGLGAGSVPFQTWYLHRRGLDVGPGVGLMTLQYVFHKTAVLLYATVLLLAGRPWIAAHSDGVLRICPGPTLSWQASSWGSSPSARCRWCSVWPGGCCIFCPTRAAGPSAGKAGWSSWTP